LRPGHGAPVIAQQHECDSTAPGGGILRVDQHRRLTFARRLFEQAGIAQLPDLGTTPAAKPCSERSSVWRQPSPPEIYCQKNCKESTAKKT
jgi:hypothetical protein